MKTTVKLILIALTISLVSCSKSNDNNVTPSNTNKTEQVTGNWTVNYYLDSGKEESSDFAGYTFAFNSGDVLEAINGATTFTGTWTIGSSSSKDDISSNRLVITISGNKVMQKLQHDWLIVKITTNAIWLRDDNVLNNEEIHFVR
jgi:hypothetical protein